MYEEEKVKILEQNAYNNINFHNMRIMFTKKVYLLVFSIFQNRHFVKVHLNIALNLFCNNL